MGLFGFVGCSPEICVRRMERTRHAARTDITLLWPAVTRHQCPSISKVLWLRYWTPRSTSVVLIAGDWFSILPRNRFTIDLQESLIPSLNLLKDDSDNMTLFSLGPPRVAFSYCACTPIPSGYAIGTT